MSSWETAKSILKFTSPVTWLVAEGAERAYKAVNSASDEGIDKLKQEVAKQNIKIQFELQQARIAQELAISRRIDNAEEVEIEEFYDTSGKGGVGISADSNSGTATIGANGEGRRVTKRIYRFKGLSNLGEMTDNAETTQVLSD